MRGHAAVLTALLALALAATGCGERERANPFDPRNPATGGRPSGFRALAGDGVVALRWDRPAPGSVVGFDLRRRGPGDADFVPYGVLPPATTFLSDAAVANGGTYHYRLAFVFASGPGALVAEDRATPGPARPWVTDPGAGALLRLTADGRHVFERVEGGGLGAPSDLAVDPGLGVVWAADVDNGEVVGVLSAGVRPYRITGFSLPGAIAVDPLDHTIWVCDQTAGSVRHHLPTGAPALPAALGPFALPVAVAVDPADRSLWMCEHDGSRLRRFATSGAQLGETAVSAPRSLAIDSLTRDVWVTSLTRGRVWRFSSELVREDSVTAFAGPVDVAIDHRRGRVWVADPVAGEVVALARDGTVEFRVGRLPGARSVAVDLARGEAWAVVTDAGRVVRISPSGAVLDATGGLARPWDIALAP